MLKAAWLRYRNGALKFNLVVYLNRLKVSFSLKPSIRYKGR